MAKITEVMGNLDRDTVAKACCRFPTRIKAVVEGNGDLLNKVKDNAYDFHIFFISIKSEMF